jgi:hypothetical protein
MNSLESQNMASGNDTLLRQWLMLRLIPRYPRAYFSPSWTAFQADRGRDFSVIVDGISN